MYYKTKAFDFSLISWESATYISFETLTIFHIIIIIIIFDKYYY